MFDFTFCYSNSGVPLSTPLWILSSLNKKLFFPVNTVVSIVVQLPSCVRLFATPWAAARQASLSLSIFRSLPKFMSIALVMPASHLIL